MRAAFADRIRCRTGGSPSRSSQWRPALTREPGAGIMGWVSCRTPIWQERAGVTSMEDVVLNGYPEQRTMLFGGVTVILRPILVGVNGPMGLKSGIVATRVKGMSRKLGRPGLRRADLGTST
jgi:hypothetical protein